MQKWSIKQIGSDCCLRFSTIVKSTNVKLRFLGIGFVWAWVYCAFETFALYPDRDGIGINADPSWMFRIVTTILVFIISGLYFRQKDLVTYSFLQYAAPLLTCVGTFLSSMSFFNGDILDACSGIISGAGVAWLIILWVDVISKLEIEQIERVIPGAFIITLICTFTVPYLQGPFGVIVVSGMPLLSGALLILSYRDDHEVPKFSRTASVKSELIKKVLRIALILMVCYFIIGFVDAMSQAQYIFQDQFGFDLATFIGSASGIVLLVLFILYSKRIDFTFLFKWLAPLLIVGIACMSWYSLVPNLIGKTLLSVSHTCILTISYLYLITSAKRYNVQVTLGMCIAAAGLEIGVLCGSLAGNFASPYVISGEVSLSVVALILICIFSIVLVTIPGRSKASMVRYAVKDGKEVKLDDLCDSFAARYRLSQREREVLGYLVRGRSQPYIRETLLLSRSTVSTHVKHIYEKLGINSKQELLDLFESNEVASHY